MTIIQGTKERLKLALTDITGKPHDAGGTLTLIVTRPGGTEDKAEGGEIVHEGAGGSGLYYHDYDTSPETGLYHYRWLDSGQVALEGDFEVESKFAEGEEPDLTDVRVLVPRARRKIEGPFGLPQGRAPLTDSVVYNMVGDAIGEIVMLSGSFFHHTLEVKERDSLGGFPTKWKTNSALTEWEAAIVTSQVALNFYQYLFRDMKVSETIQNEGTVWTYEFSANAIRTYYESLMKERDDAIAGLRINNPVLDRFASNIRVRDQATVAVLEWWAGQFDQGVAVGGLPGGQEAAVVPVFYPPTGF